MEQKEIRETLALVGALRGIAEEPRLDQTERELETKRRVFRIAAEITEHLNRLEERIAAVSETTEAEGEERLHRLASLGRVTAEVGHRINNLLPLLTTRMNLCGVCIEQGDSAKAISNCRIALQQLQKVEALAVRLIDFSGDPFEPVLSDLNDVVRATVSFARLLSSYENIQFDIDLAPDLHAASVDPARWQQLLLALIANAADAVGRRKGEGGAIAITTKNDPNRDEVVLVVQDAGRGIAPKDLPHVFEPGFTTKGPRREGLGLAVCKRCVEEAGGKIAIESRQGDGASIIITLPASR